MPGNRKHSQMVEHSKLKEKHEQEQKDEENHQARVNALQAMKRAEHDQREKSIPRLSRMLPKGPPMIRPETLVEEDSTINPSSSTVPESSFRVSGLERAFQRSFRRKTSGPTEAEKEDLEHIAADVRPRDDLLSPQLMDAPPEFRRKPSRFPTLGSAPKVQKDEVKNEDQVLPRDGLQNLQRHDAPPAFRRKPSIVSPGRSNPKAPSRATSAMPSLGSQTSDKKV
jgi:hypothetical protein